MVLNSLSFCLAAFNICSLCLIFVSLINMCLRFILFGTLGFLNLGGYFLPHFREVWPFFLSSSSGTPMIQMLGHLTLSQRSLRLSSFLFILFSSLFHLFIPFYLPPHLSYLLPQLFYCWFPRVLLISVIALFIID